MKPIDYPSVNCVVGGEIPAQRTEHGFILSRWSMTWRERLAILLHGKVWLAVIGETMQPTLLSGDQTFSITQEQLNKYTID